MTPFIVSLTFDDGWKSAITDAFPILEEYHLPATFYIISKTLDDKIFPQYMNLADLKMLQIHGHEIGGHTKSHLHLSELSDLEMRDEIVKGKEDLQSLGLSISTFAYPYGDWNSRIVKRVRETGFFAARSIREEINDRGTNLFLLGAYPVLEKYAAEDVISLIHRLSKMGGWAVLCFHQIESSKILREKNWIYGTTPAVLKRICEFLDAEQIQTYTVREKGSLFVVYSSSIVSLRV